MLFDNVCVSKYNSTLDLVVMNIKELLSPWYSMSLFRSVNVFDGIFKGMKEFKIAVSSLLFMRLSKEISIPALQVLCGSHFYKHVKS